MARPSLGAAAKSRVVAIRITPAEEEALARRYGSAPRGVRAIVSAALNSRSTVRDTKEQES